MRTNYFAKEEEKTLLQLQETWLQRSGQITLLKKKNRLYSNYKRHGYKDEDKLLC